MFDSSDGISVVIYVLTATGEVMDGDSLLASIQVEKSCNCKSIMTGFPKFAHRMGLTSTRTTVSVRWLLKGCLVASPKVVEMLAALEVSLLEQLLASPLLLC